MAAFPSATRPHSVTGMAGLQAGARGCPHTPQRSPLAASPPQPGAEPSSSNQRPPEPTAPARGPCDPETAAAGDQSATSAGPTFGGPVRVGGGRALRLPRPPPQRVRSRERRGCAEAFHSPAPPPNRPLLSTRRRGDTREVPRLRDRALPGISRPSGPQGPAVKGRRSRSRSDAEGALDGGRGSDSEGSRRADEGGPKRSLPRSGSASAPVSHQPLSRPQPPGRPRVTG